MITSSSLAYIYHLVEVVWKYAFLFKTLKGLPHTVCGKKPLPLPFNETERNGPFNETERAVHDPFFIRSRSVRICHPF